MKLAYIHDHAEVDIPPLNALLQGLPLIGHSIERFSRDTQYDCVIICSSPHWTSHWGDTLNYLDNARLTIINWTEYSHQHSSIHSRFDFYSGFTDSVFAWNQDIAKAHRPVRELLRGRSFLYFSRELFKQVLYPDGYYPIDPIDCCGPKVPLVSQEEFLDRKRFLFVSCQNNHPHRLILASLMLNWACSNHVPHYVVCDNYSPSRRLSLADYHAGLNESQVSVAYDGYASSYSQPEILRRCTLVRNEPSRLRPFQIGNGCVEYTCKIPEPTNWRKDLRLDSTNLIEVLDGLYRNRRVAYEVYCQGHAFVHKYHTAESVAEYFVDKITKHDWYKPTSWEVVPLDENGNKAVRKDKGSCPHLGRYSIKDLRAGLLECQDCKNVVKVADIPKELKNKRVYVS